MIPSDHSIGNLPPKASLSQTIFRHRLPERHDMRGSVEDTEVHSQHHQDAGDKRGVPGPIFSEWKENDLLHSQPA